MLFSRILASGVCCIEWAVALQPRRSIGGLHHAKVSCEALQRFHVLSCVRDQYRKDLEIWRPPGDARLRRTFPQAKLDSFPRTRHSRDWTQWKFSHARVTR